MMSIVITILLSLAVCSIYSIFSFIVIPTQCYVGLFITYTKVICDPEAETLTIIVKRYCLGYVFKSCLSPVSDGHFNLRDVTAFSTGFSHTRKSRSTKCFIVATNNGTNRFNVDMPETSGRQIRTWMNTYIRRRAIQNVLAPPANNVHPAEEIHVDTEPHAGYIAPLLPNPLPNL